jgi:alcohol dehydrogenase class IV
MRTLKVPWYSAGVIDPYFGTGMITEMVEATGKNPIPVIAVQSASGSAAHLTKYSNITDPVEGQKKLIVDDAIVPKYSIFDYQVTEASPRDLTLDGALDGIAHIWEVFMGASGSPFYDKIKEISVLGFSLIINNLKAAIDGNLESRVALGLGTDLGGYAIMIGGTNGPHLGSFSLVDILTHGRACAILYPYYTVFFAPRIQDQLAHIVPIFEKAGYIKRIENTEISNQELGNLVARAMIEFNSSLGFPTTLKEAGASYEHLERMLEAAKDPQLRMKLQNMPVPLVPEDGDIDVFMKSILEAAYNGNLENIILKN